MASLKSDRPIGFGRAGCALGGFCLRREARAALPAGVAVPSPEARQTVPLGRQRSVQVAREVGEGRTNSMAGRFCVNGSEAARRWKGVLGGPRDTPVSNCGQVNARQGEIRVGLEQLP
jgi:hypothetical protein